MVVIFLTFLIAISMIYLFAITLHQGYSSMLYIDNSFMFSDIFKHPFGPVGFYALGIMASIFYFEYSQAVSNRALRRRKAY